MMGAMSDLHIDICGEIEDVMCKELDMEHCQRTYEIATLIFDAMTKKMDELKINSDVVHIDHVNTLTIN